MVIFTVKFKVQLKKLRFLFLLLAFGMAINTASSQYANVRDSIVFAPMIMPTIGVHFPLGDVQQAYKFTYHVGGQFLIKNRKNWLYGFSGEFMFGENVGVPGLMQNIYPVYGISGTPPGVTLAMRGFNIMAQGGKIIPLGGRSVKKDKNSKWKFKPNGNSGIMFLFGVGFIDHKLQISFRGDNVPQVNDDYIKGYDRLHYGLALSQFIGYIYMGNNRSVNFFAGFEFIEGFTRNRRVYNYDTQSQDVRDKYDIFIGLKGGYIFPFYRKGTGSTNKAKEKEYFYK